MNKTGRVADYLGHILQAMARIERHTAGVDAYGLPLASWFSTPSSATCK